MKKFFKILIAILVIIIIAYFILSRGDVIDVSDNPVYNQFHQDSHLHETEKFKGVSVSIIKTATAESKAGLVIGGESLLDTFEISHNAILIRHPKGNILFDTGLGNHIKQQFEDIPALLHPVLAYSFIKSAQKTLEPAHIDIAKIIISHFHWDHVGGVKDFPDADILVDQVDYERAKEGKDGAVLSQINGKNIHWRFISFTNTPYENFEQSFDVYGDDSLIIVPLPGHTHGSIGLFVNTEAGIRYFLTGDATYSLLGFTKPAEKSFLLKNVLDLDHKTLIQTILKVHYLMLQYPDLIVVPAHDAKLQNTLPQFQVEVK